jgi:dTDP-4-amino-4,6-dideoxygalactose transaminase
MNVPFLDLKANYLSIKEEVLKEWEDVLENTYYVLGPKVTAFEEAFAQAHQVNHAIAVSTGTDGNHLACLAAGVGHGDEVIVPANTFIATAWGATLCGATPVFVDCEPDSYNLDPNALEAAITERTKAVVAVHLYGQPADLDPIKAICDKHGIALLEDAAQSHLAEYKGKPIGGFGKLTSFSFYPGKNLGAWGEGGAVTTNDAEAAEFVQMVRNQGQEKKYYHKVHGHNYRMAALQGAVLGVKMKYIAGWTENRRKVAAYYNEHLAGIEELVLPKEMDYAKHVYHLYVVQSAERDALGKHLGDNGVASGLHYPVPLHMQECFQNLGYSQGQFPNSEQLGSRCLSLPMYPEMTEEHMAAVCKAVKSYYKLEA